MSVFNSLGSNYSGRFVWKSWFTIGHKKDAVATQALLAGHYHGKATLTYKGRQALELAFRHSNLPKGSQVGINGFTCYVVYEAIEKAGYKPVFLDVKPGTLHFGLEQVQNLPDIKAVVIQNTLGIPADLPAIEKYRRQHKILIVEDLAHSFGATYADGREAGTVGDLTMLSFSQDKPLDVVAGGALVDRRSQPAAIANRPLVSLWQRYTNRKYPYWTALIRGTYGIGLGRYIHFGLKKFHLLATPMSDNLKDLRAMSNSAAKLLGQTYQQKDQELAHRQTIAKIYQQELPKEMQFPAQGKPVYLRFPIKLANRDSLISYLKSQHIHIGDTWYDAPVGPKKYLARTDYQAGQCPEAEKLVQTIVNLPTHKHVTTEVAQNICAKIKQWSQQQK